MRIDIVSDLHLFDAHQRFLFDTGKERVFSALCDDILRVPDGELVLAGDVFDFSGMNPCPVAHRDFFTEAIPASRLDQDRIDRACQYREPHELLQAIFEIFPQFFEALGGIARAGRLTYIPGNHDCALQGCDLQGTAARDFLARLLNAPTDAIKWRDSFSIPGRLLVAHGNEFDAANSTAHGCHNPGEVFTSALYRGILPALEMLGLKTEIIAAIPAVRPEEQALHSLEFLLPPADLHRLLVAFARLLSRNGFFRGMQRLPGWFLKHQVPGVSDLVAKTLTPDRVRKVLPNDENLKLSARIGARSLRTRLRATNSEMAEALVVFGHTHELDFVAKDRYVNLGTWIDHMVDLSPESIEKPDTKLPVLRISLPEPAHSEVRLYDAQNLAAGEQLSDCPLLDSMNA